MLCFVIEGDVYESMTATPRKTGCVVVDLLEDRYRAHPRI